MGEIFLMSERRWSSDANGLEESEKVPQSHLYSLLLIELDSEKIKLVDRSNRIRKKDYLNGQSLFYIYYQKNKGRELVGRPPTRALYYRLSD